MPEPVTPAVPPPASKPVSPFDLGEIMAEYETDRAAAEKPAEPQSQTAAEKPAEKKPESLGVAPGDRRKARLVRRAVELGLGRPEAELMDVEDLEDEVHYLSEKALAEARAEAKAAAAVRVKDETAAAIPEEIDLGVPKESVDGLDDDLVKILRKQAAEIAELKRQMASGAQAQQAREAATVGQRLDALFAGDEAAFGKKPTGKTDPRSKEGARRLAVIAYLNNLAGSKQATTLEADFAAAVEALGFSSAAPGVELARQEEDRWAKAGAARPTQRNAQPEPKGEGRAARAVQEKREELGLTVNGNVEIDHFPD